MSNNRFCDYQYVCGPKKNTVCGKFIRALGNDKCCQHKTKTEIKQKPKIEEQTIEQPKEQIKRTTPVKLFKKKAVKLVSSSESSEEPQNHIPKEPKINKLPINKVSNNNDSVSELVCSSSSSSSFSVSDDSSSSSFSISDD